MSYIIGLLLEYDEFESLVHTGVEKVCVTPQKLSNGEHYAGWSGDETVCDEQGKSLPIPTLSRKESLMTFLLDTVCRVKVKLLHKAYSHTLLDATSPEVRGQPDHIIRCHQRHDVEHTLLRVHLVAESILKAIS